VLKSLLARVSQQPLQVLKVVCVVLLHGFLTLTHYCAFEETDTLDHVTPGTALDVERDLLQLLSWAERRIKAILDCLGDLNEGFGDESIAECVVLAKVLHEDISLVWADHEQVSDLLLHDFGWRERNRVLIRMGELIAIFVLQLQVFKFGPRQWLVPVLPGRLEFLEFFGFELSNRVVTALDDHLKEVGLMERCWAVCIVSDALI